MCGTGALLQARSRGNVQNQLFTRLLPVTMSRLSHRRVRKRPAASGFLLRCLPAELHDGIGQEAAADEKPNATVNFATESCTLGRPTLLPQAASPLPRCLIACHHSAVPPQSLRIHRPQP